MTSQRCRSCQVGSNPPMLCFSNRPLVVDSTGVVRVIQDGIDFLLAGKSISPARRGTGLSASLHHPLLETSRILAGKPVADRSLRVKSWGDHLQSARSHKAEDWRSLYRYVHLLRLERWLEEASICIDGSRTQADAVDFHMRMLSEVWLASRGRR